MSKKHMIQRGYQGRLEDAYTTLENEDKQIEQDIRNTIDYVNLPANQKNRSFGKRRDKANKPQRGGIRE